MIRRNVLIFHAGALGDFLVTWPLAMGLGRLYPQSRIIYVTATEKGRLAEELLGVEWADVEAGWHHLYADASALPERARALLTGARAVFSFVSTPGDAWTSSLRAMAPSADLHVLRPTPPEGYPRHASHFILDELRGELAVAEAMRQMLRSIEQRGVGRAIALGGDVVIHPGSGSPAKCWPAERFVELAQRLAGSGRRVRFVIGEVERDHWPAAQIDALRAAGEVRMPGSYVEMARELASASMYIGNDSGPSHLAGMLGLRTHCLFGPTDPAVWSPLGPRVRAMRCVPLSALDVDEVLAWINQRT